LQTAGRGFKRARCRLHSQAESFANPEVPFGNYNEGMTFRIVLEYDADAQAFSAVCPELPGCASAGDTEDEAKQNIKEAIELYLAPSDVELSRDAKLVEVTVG
jgi:predicted RNase H-like HicB family nuclease